MAAPITISYHGLSGTIRQFSDITGIDYHTLVARIRRGWSAERAIETPLRHKGRGPRTHGATGSKEYVAWKSMIFRCENPKNNRWHRYGGRSISVCKRWRESFQAFFADVGPAPSEQHSLGRWDHDGDYEPGGNDPEPAVSWQTPQQQAVCWRKSQRRGNDT